ncbi:MAG TPA: TonB-dependent receptor, partial [Candidatus Elarobacter sp.]|nr:TonB-dependent receptor [Candidatus Elarobacter sp.]
MERPAFRDEEHWKRVSSFETRGSLAGRAAAALALALALVNGAVAASAQAATDEASLVVSVRDAATHAGIRANVKIAGPLSETRYTDANGSMTLYGLPPGQYTVQAGAGSYKSSDVVTATLAASQSSTVEFELARRESMLRSIGRVAARPASRPRYDVVTQDAPLRLLSESLNAALGNVPGVDLSTSTDTGEPQALFGLEGHDPTQTAVTLDGVPLNAPGTAFDASLIPSDLLSSGAVAFGSTPGFTAGSIDYRTAAPARDPVATVVGQAGALGSSTLAELLRGSRGRLGYVVGANALSADSPLAGQRFADWSGLTWDHPGGWTQHGTLVKLQYLLGDTDAFSATLVNGARHSRPICPLATTATPCSLGLTASGSTTAGVGSLRLTGSHAAMTYAISAFRVSRDSVADYGSRSIAGAPYPATRSAGSNFAGSQAHVDLHVDPRDTLGATILQTSVDVTERQFSVIDGTTRLVGTDRQMLFSFDASRQLSAATRATAQVAKRHDALGAATSLQLNGTTKLSAHDSVGARVALASGAGGPTLSGLTTAPDFLNFTCAGPYAFGRASTIVNEGGRTIDERVAYTHAGSSGSLSVALFEQSAHDVPFNYPLSATAFSPAVLAGYLTSANAVLHRATICPGDPALDPAHLYFYAYLN